MNCFKGLYSFYDFYDFYDLNVLSDSDNGLLTTDSP